MTITAFQVDQWEKEVNHLKSIISGLIIERDTALARLAEVERERDEARTVKAETLAAARSIVYWQDALKAMEVERDVARAQVATLAEALRTYANPILADEVIREAGVEP